MLTERLRGSDGYLMVSMLSLRFCRVALGWEEPLVERALRGAGDLPRVSGGGGGSSAGGGSGGGPSGIGPWFLSVTLAAPGAEEEEEEEEEEAPGVDAGSIGVFGSGGWSSIPPFQATLDLERA